MVTIDRIDLPKQEMEERVTRFVAANAQQVSGTWEGGERYALERLLLEGETVAVLGQASWGADAASSASRGGYRDQPRRLTLQAPAGGVLHVTDDPRLHGRPADGKGSELEELLLGGEEGEEGEE